MRSSFITYVWLLSVIVHPFLWVGWELLTDGFGGIDIFWAALFAGFLFSLPVYVVCLLLSEWMLPSGRSIAHQFFSWICWIAGLVFLMTLVVMLFFESDWSMVQFACQVVMAPVVAIFLSTGLRYKQLIQLNIHLNNPQPHDTLDTTAVE